MKEIFERSLRGFLLHGGKGCLLWGLLQVYGQMIEVVCGVIRDGEVKVLACRRSAERHLGACGNFPEARWIRGRVLRIALARELREELGISVEVGGQVGEPVEWSDGKVTIRLTAFFCKNFRRAACGD